MVSLEEAGFLLMRRHLLNRGGAVHYAAISPYAEPTPNALCARGLHTQVRDLVASDSNAAEST